MNVTRRTVLKSIAASLIVPTISLRREIDREALMMPFCYPGAGRYDLHSPFQQGPLSYATDSFRIIRAELSSPEINGERRVPQAAQLFKDHWKPTQWRGVDRPELTQLLMAPGVTRREITANCPTCFDRMIRVDLDDPNLVDKWESYERRGIRLDPDEATHGDTSCPKCRGKDYFGPSLIEIGNEYYSYHLLAPVWDLPGEIRFANNRDPGQPLLFKADGFEGMVMPVEL